MASAIKFGLILAAAAVIVCVIVKMQPEERPSYVEQPENKYTYDEINEQIDEKITLLDTLPDSSFEFNQNLYNEIRGLIKNHYEDGKTAPPNDGWKNDLEKRLYYVYAGRFISQANAVFDDSDWNAADLKFIGNECQTLQKSEWLERGGQTDTDLAEIQENIARYNEIDKFIADCGSSEFSYSGFAAKIAKAEEYLSDTDYEAVNNCARLRNGLEEIKRILFGKHIDYLNKKIDASFGKYSGYKSRDEYMTGLYDPLKAEIDSLISSKDIYDGIGFSEIKNKHSELLKKWNADGYTATGHFR